MKHALVLILMAPTLFGAAAIRPQQLRTEYRVNPQGIDVTDPRLSWVLAAADAKARGLRQTAYRVIVASTERALARGRRPLGHRQGGVRSVRPGGLSRQTSYFRRRCLLESAGLGPGRPAQRWSAPAQWSMGLLHPQDWQAKWIGRDEPGGATVAHRLAARLLRKEFQAPKPVRRATVYYSGLGLSELYLNGAKVGDHVLSPGLTDYDKHVLYVTFDVTKQIAAGRNAIGLMLGNGRYHAPRLEAKTRNFGDPKAILRLDVEYEDGSRSSVVSDETWKLSTAGPIRANNEYDGEEYDARMELPGWNRAGFDDSKWEAGPHRGGAHGRAGGADGRAAARHRDAAPRQRQDAQARRVHFRYGSEHGGLVPAAKSPAPREPKSRCGTPRRSTPTARSTPPTCAPRAPPISTPSRAKARKSGSRASPTTASATSR
jgi:alpha-L-rhamnosidase